jgi:UPF0755 protein
MDSDDRRWGDDRERHDNRGWSGRGWDDGGWDDDQWVAGSPGRSGILADDRETPADEFDWDHDDELFIGRSPRYRLIRAMVVLAVILIVGFGSYRLVRGWIDRQLDPPGEPGETVAVVIEPGSTTDGIASHLEAEGIIPNSTIFRYYADWKGEGNFQAGEYQMQLNSSADEAIAVLNAGPAPQSSATFTVPEGRWISEMLPAIADQLPNITVEDLQAVLDSGELPPSYQPDGVTSWEGLLFPSTYEVGDDATASDVLTLMNEEFQSVASDLGYGSVELPGGRSAYEVITIASMVEAEAKVEGDRAMISRVIYNRLQEEMSIDIDATCIYGSGDRQVALTTDLMRNGVGGYACRDFSGLPPTPIAAPSRASLEAALHPADGPWLFYVVADAEGRHAFAETLAEHDVNVTAAEEAGLLD